MNVSTLDLIVERFNGPIDGRPGHFLLEVERHVLGYATPMHGSAHTYRHAAIAAAMAVLLACKLGCRVETAAVGQTSCDSEWHWLVTVTPNHGMCNLLDCFACRFMNCDACDLVEMDEEPLHGNDGLGANRTLPWLLIGWAVQHVEFLGLAIQWWATARPIAALLSEFQATKPEGYPTPYDMRRYEIDVSAISVINDI